MDSQSTTEFRSGEPRIAIFTAIACLIPSLAAASAGDDFRWVTLILIGIAAYHAWKAITIWKLPAVRLSGDALEVFVHGKLAHYIPLDRIVSIDKGMNATVLQLNNGSTVSVGSAGFLWSADVKAFQSALESRLAGT